jgi:hypothetical protein
MRLIVPAEEVALIEVARVKRGSQSPWRDVLEKPVALWDGIRMAEVLHLIERMPAGMPKRCFNPGFGLRLHDQQSARAEVLFCFHCHSVRMIDLQDLSRSNVAEAFDAGSDPARELLARLQGAKRRGRWFGGKAR